MRRMLVPLAFVFLVTIAFTLTTVLPASADISGKPAHSFGECPSKA